MVLSLPGLQENPSQAFRGASAEGGNVSAAGCQDDAVENSYRLGRRLTYLLALPPADPMATAILEAAGMGLPFFSQFRFAL